MTRLLLLRHSRAGWPEPGMRDFDRPLDATGAAEAVHVGIMMRENACRPDLVVCSGARRARQTLEGVRAHTETGHAIYTDILYSTDAIGYLDVVRQAPTANTLLLIGHNPMMEDLLLALAAQGDPQALDASAAGFPPSGLAVIRFDGALAEAEPGKGYLEAFLTPAAQERAA